MNATATPGTTARAKRRGRGSTWKYSVLWPAVFMAPFVLCYCAFNLYPVLYSFGLSFTSWDGLGEKVFVGLANYRSILTGDPNFLKSLRNTLYIVLVANPLTLILGLLLANFLFGLRRGSRFFQTVNFLPYITAPVALGLIFSFLFDWSMGTVNLVLKGLGLTQEGINWLGHPRYAPLVIMILIVWKYTGYYMSIFLAGITSIPDELYEAARVDGAGRAAVFLRITIPMLRPIITFAAVTSLIGGLQLFDEPSLIFTGTVGGPDRSVLTIVWNFYDVSFRNSRLGYGSAVAFTLFLIIVVISTLGNRLLGGRKGERP